MNILTINLLFSTLVFAIAAKLYLLPRLPDLEPRRRRSGARSRTLPPLRRTRGRTTRAFARRWPT